MQFGIFWYGIGSISLVTGLAMLACIFGCMCNCLAACRNGTCCVCCWDCCTFGRHRVTPEPSAADESSRPPSCQKQQQRQQQPAMEGWVQKSGVSCWSWSTAASEEQAAEEAVQPMQRPEAQLIAARR